MISMCGWFKKDNSGKAEQTLKVFDKNYSEDILTV